MATTRVIIVTAITVVACMPRGRAPDIEPKSNVPVAIAKPGPVAKQMPAEPFTLRDDRERAIEVYPPIAKQPRAPMVVFLHATPGGSCARRPTRPARRARLARARRREGRVPRERARQVEGELPTFVDERPGVLIGWSRGAFAARDILTASIADQTSSLAKRFRGLVLIAAHVTPGLAMLKQAGVTRVVMAAGEYDLSKPTMVFAVATLQKGGFEARFISLGKIAHVWPNDFDMRMREPIARAAGGS